MRPRAMVGSQTWAVPAGIQQSQDVSLPHLRQSAPIREQIRGFVDVSGQRAGQRRRCIRGTAQDHFLRVLVENGNGECVETGRHANKGRAALCIHTDHLDQKHSAVSNSEIPRLENDCCVERVQMLGETFRIGI